MLAVPAIAKATNLVRPVEEKIKSAEEQAKKVSELAGPVQKASNAIDTVNRAKSSVTGGSNRPKGGKGGSSEGEGGSVNRTKATTIIESVDVGVPVHVAYDAWTQFTEFPSFMKKVEGVEQESDEKLSWTARVAWSSRTWETEILEQVPDYKVVWRGDGNKGYVDGAVTFHELAPDLTRILLVLEYHPRGLFEHTGNLWRAQGRRARLELKHFQRHVMTEVAASSEAPEGWRGRIHEGSVVESGESDAADEDEPQGKAGSDGDSNDGRDRDEQNRQGLENDEELEHDEELENDEELDKDPADDEEPEDEEAGRENGQVRASARGQSQPMRRRQTSSGDGDDEGTSTRRGARSSRNGEPRQGGNGESDDAGRRGRVVGNRSERRVGQRETKEGTHK